MYIDRNIYILVVFFLSFLETLSSLFGFISREILSAITLIILFACCALGLLVYKVDRKSSKNNYLLLIFLSFHFIYFSYYLNFLTSFGTFLKLFIYLLFCSLLSSSRLDFYSLHRSIYVFGIIFLSFHVLYGIVFDTSQILNSRFRFVGAAHTSSLISMLTSLFTFFYFFSYKCNLRKGLSMFLFLSFFSFCYFSGSRQPFYALMLTLFIFLLSSHRIVFSKFIAMSAFFSIVILSAISYLILDSRGYLELFGLSNDGSIISRLSYINVGIDYLLSNDFFLFGSGLNSFPNIYYSVTSVEAPATHNFILFILMNFGLFGFLFFAVYFIRVIYKLKSKYSIYLFVLFLSGFTLNNPEYFVTVIFSFLIFIKVFNCHEALYAGRLCQAKVTT